MASEGAPFKGPLTQAATDAMQALAARNGWTFARAVRRAVRAFLMYTACRADMVLASPASSHPSPYPGRYDTGIESETIAAVERLARLHGVRRYVVVSTALVWYENNHP